jgi:F-type H+-transporting ATPase subunit epsilon
MMHLKIALPTEILLEEEVDKVSAEGMEGSFTILPRHIDMTTALVPGLLSFVSGGEETFVAVDEGILVKRGESVHISARNAVMGGPLDELSETVDTAFREYNEKEKSVHTALAKLETDFTKRLIEMRQ